MTEPTNPSRRQVLLALLGTAAGLALGSLPAAAATPARLAEAPLARLAAGLPGRETAAVAAWIHDRIGAAAAVRLTDAQGARLAAGPVTAERVGTLIAEDFRSGRTLSVDGLLLSEMETALYLAVHASEVPVA